MLKRTGATCGFVDRGLLLIRSIVPPPNWFLSILTVVYPGMENRRFGESLVSLTAAMSILLMRRNMSNSAFLLVTELAFQAITRRL